MKKQIATLAALVGILFGHFTHATVIDLAQYVTVRDNGDQYIGPNILVGGGGGTLVTARTYMQFDVSSLTGTVAEATLALTLAGQNGYMNGGHFNAHRVTSNWTAASVYWTAQPTFDMADVATVAGDDMQAAAGDTFYWDITDLVQFWIDHPAQNFGLALEADDSYGYASFAPFSMSVEPSQVPLPPSAWLLFSAAGLFALLMQRGQAGRAAS